MTGLRGSHAPVVASRRFSHSLLAAAVGVVVLAGSAQGATPLKTDVPAAPGPSLAQSLSLAQDALDDCAARGYAASVSVVDSTGLAKVVLRSDEQGKPPVAAPKKAATAVAFDQAGSDMEAREKTDPAFAAQLAAHPDIYNDHPGSVPLHLNGVLIGGLAVADVPHDVADACARAALAKSPLN